MKKHQYETLELWILLSEYQDVITSSGEDTVDDMGDWNDEWFKKNG
jgi:hypothetical protein